MKNLHGRFGKRNMDFYKGKRVFVTGGTGFKGSWLCKLLSWQGAEVMSYALAPNTDPNLFEITNIEKDVKSIIGDIRDLDCLYKAYNSFKPDVVFHLAAQPLVRESYEVPVYTYETNVIGTVNILECIRRNADHYCSIINVTTDKVYKNNEWVWGYRENETLNGHDPYSNSKSCSELVTSSYKISFFNDLSIPVSTVRAGNVIGGGDFAKDRIIPDCVRAVNNNVPIIVRNPNSIRPYQHVLESIVAYMMIGSRQYDDVSLAGSYNVGPDISDCVTTEFLVDIFCRIWGGTANWKTISINGPYEANFLKLDCSKIKAVFDWSPVWNVEKAVEKTIEFCKAYYTGDDVEKVMKRQADEYLKGFTCR